MSFRARRRTGHPVRLTAELTRGRGAGRALGHAPHTTAVAQPDVAPALRSSARAVAAERTAGRAGNLISGPLLARWIKNESGQLVMTWSPAPEVEAAPVISLSGRGTRISDQQPAAPGATGSRGSVSRTSDDSTRGSPSPLG